MPSTNSKQEKSKQFISLIKIYKNESFIKNKIIIRIISHILEIIKKSNLHFHCLEFKLNYGCFKKIILIIKMICYLGFAGLAALIYITVIHVYIKLLLLKLKLGRSAIISFIPMYGDYFWFNKSLEKYRDSLAMY